MRNAVHIWAILTCPLRTAALAIMLTCASSVSADPYPWDVGVTVHLGTKVETREYDPLETIWALSWLGEVSFRDDLVWQRFPEARVYLQLPSTLVGLQMVLDSSGRQRRPLLILAGNNSGQGVDVLPATDADRLRVAKHFDRALPAVKVYDPWIELWNEWSVVRHPRQSQDVVPEKYVAYVRTMLPVVKKRLPNSKVLVGVAGWDGNWDWLKQVVRLGGLKGVDGLSAHVYQCYSKVHDVAQLAGRVRELHDEVSAVAGHSVPIHLTEVGWPTFGGRCGVSPDQAAERLSQFMLRVAAFSWLKSLWIYELKDSGRDPTSIQSHFGLFTHDYRVKPGACAVRGTLAFLRNRRLQDLTETKERFVTATFSGPNGKLARAIWSMSPRKVFLKRGERAWAACASEKSDVAVNSVIVGQMPVFVESTL